MSVEVHDFPTDKANAVLAKVHMLPDGMTADEFRAQTADFVRRTLDEQYGGHGFVGYARWILASSVMEYSVPTETEPFRLTAHQYRWWWLVRVILSAVLLVFGIYASVGSLATEPAAEGDSSDAPMAGHPPTHPSESLLTGQRPTGPSESASVRPQAQGGPMSNDRSSPALPPQGSSAGS